MNRRAFLRGTAALTLTGAVAGCIGPIGDPFEFEAVPGAVSTDALDETGYEHVDTEPVIYERSVDTPIGSRDIVVQNWLSEYQRAVDLGPLGSIRAAVFSVMTSPQVSVPGREFNPIAEMSSRELADQVADQYDEFGSVEHVVDETIELLGDSTTIGVFDAEAVIAGIGVDLDLRISDPVSVGDDYLVAIGAAPSIVPNEDEAIRTLIRGVEYEP